MSHYAMKSSFAACDEIRGSFACSDRKNNSPVFCPKPRRLSLLASVDPVRPLKYHTSYQADLCDPKAGVDLIDLLLSKGEEQNPVAASPPFFCGSPPSRVSNPVVHDSRFGEGCPLVPVLPYPMAVKATPQPLAPTPMSPRAGCVRAKFGFQPAAVRVEGFDCLDRDRRGRGHSITAVA